MHNHSGVQRKLKKLDLGLQILIKNLSFDFAVWKEEHNMNWVIFLEVTKWHTTQILTES